MRDDSTKAQNDTRPPPPPASSSPSTSGGGGGGGGAKPERATPPAAEAKEDDNPVKVEGPGPRPVEEIAREHGGDAGAAKPESLEGDRAAGQGEDEGAGAPRRDSAKSLGEGGEGEQCVQSSGLAADGGDFDAARPGAGKEADREYLPFYSSSSHFLLSGYLFLRCSSPLTSAWGAQHGRATVC